MLTISVDPATLLEQQPAYQGKFWWRSYSQCYSHNYPKANHCELTKQFAMVGFGKLWVVWRSISLAYLINMNI